EDRSRLRPIYELQHGAVETVQGTIGAVRQFRPRGRQGLVITRAAVTDGSGVLHAVWYNQPYLARHLTHGRTVVLHGRVARRAGGSCTRSSSCSNCCCSARRPHGRPSRGRSTTGTRPSS